MPRRSWAHDGLYHTLRQEIGQMVRAARHKRGLTLEQLAKLLGFRDYKPLFQIEKGLMAIPPDKLAGLEEALALEQDDLFTMEAMCRLVGLGFEIRGWLRRLSARPAPVLSEDELQQLPLAGRPL